MKRINSLFFLLIVGFSLIACGRKQNMDEKDFDSLVQIENDIDTALFNETEESIVQESEKNQLTIKENPKDDGNPNTEKYIVSDKDGNSVEVQIGVVEGEEGIPDTPDDVNNSSQIISPSTENKDELAKPSVPDDVGNIGSGWDTTYDEYQAMSGTEQTIFYYSFADADEFLEWYNSAKEKYEEENEEIYIGLDGVVNAGEID